MTTKTITMPLPVESITIMKVDRFKDITYILNVFAETATWIHGVRLIMLQMAEMKYIFILY